MDYESLTVRKLKEICKARGIKGCSRMNKNRLIEQLLISSTGISDLPAEMVTEIVKYMEPQERKAFKETSTYNREIVLNWYERLSFEDALKTEDPDAIRLVVQIQNIPEEKILDALEYSMKNSEIVKALLTSGVIHLHDENIVDFSTKISNSYLNDLISYQDPDGGRVVLSNVKRLKEIAKSTNWIALWMDRNYSGIDTYKNLVLDKTISSLDDIMSDDTIPFLVFEILMENMPILKESRKFKDKVNELLRIFAFYGINDRQPNEIRQYTDALIGYGADPFSTDDLGYNVFGLGGDYIIEYIEEKHSNPRWVREALITQLAVYRDNYEIEYYPFDAQF